MIDISSGDVRIFDDEAGCVVREIINRMPSDVCEAISSLDVDSDIETITWQERDAALPMGLLGAPISPEAQALVDDLLYRVVLARTRRRERPTSIEALRRALGAIMSDLFDFQRRIGKSGEPRCGSHGTSSNDVQSIKLGFGRNLFLKVTDALVAEGYLLVLKGSPRWHTWDGVISNHGGRVTRFKLTRSVIELANDFGVQVDAWQTHWTRGKSKRVIVAPEVPRLVLKAKRLRQGHRKCDARELPIDHASPVVQRLLADIAEINVFLAEQKFGGLSFPGLKRIFNDGDQDGFSWQWGGRYFSLPGGDRYEAWSGEERRERITINGERVGEADIRSSHLTFLHALLQEPFDTSFDPYSIEGIPRDLVKSWCTHALGKSSVKARQWSGTAKADYQAQYPGRVLKEDYPISMVGEAILRRHPALRRLEGNEISTLDLQYHESEVLKMAMADLRKSHGIPALPIHDGLIVPLSRLEEAEKALKGAFRMYIEGYRECLSIVTPVVTHKIS